MGAKWERTKRWDREHLTGVWTPLRLVLHAFSSVTLAVILLTLVALYGVLASVPIGMLALIPTYLIYGATLLVTIAATIALPLGIAWLIGLRRAPRGARFAVILCSVLFFGAIGAGIWYWTVWPPLHFDPAKGTGLRLFAGFCEQYQATTLRRLPGLEMSELEFYSWWPLHLILLTFVTNMVIATARRIEFKFMNLGVLTVHTGIVTIACGSIFYAALKKEGDTILIAGPPDEKGAPTIGPPQNRFYDNTDVALYVSQHDAWEQRPLRGVPRYNAYNLAAADGPTASEAAGFRPIWLLDESDGLDGPYPTRDLSVPVPDSRFGLVDANIGLRIVGYAPYAESAQDWVKADLGLMTTVPEGFAPNPLRVVNLYDLRSEAMKAADREGRAHPAGAAPVPQSEAKPVFAFTMLPTMPAHRVSDNQVIAVEYTIAMPEERWRDLGEALPPGTEHGLVVEVPSKGFRGVFVAREGESIAVGGTGYRLEVKQLAKEPPFPIITEGYKGATSSVAVVRVIPPEGGAFERWVYHRFPEINQDMLDERNERGMPVRRDADPSIRIASIDADQVQVYFNESADGSVRALVREPGGRVREVRDGIEAGFEMVPFVTLRLKEQWEHAESFMRPRPVPPLERDRRFIGTHDKAMLAVEVTVREGGRSVLSEDERTDDAAAGPRWTRTVWVPFVKYLGIESNFERPVLLPDGRQIKLAFGRRQHRLPGFEISLIDFQMLAYDHRGAPRDYQSLVRVEPTGESFGRGRTRTFEPFDHVTKLNAPLRAPFRWDESRAWLSNMAGSLAGGLDPAQFKFSQAGWDASGWEESQKLVDQGLASRPRAAFTILGVGNNPGIHVIALGGVLMGVGIPWAFYVKPWLARREKRKIQERLKAGTYVKPGAARAKDGAAGVGAGDDAVGAAGHTGGADPARTSPVGLAASRT